MAKYINTESTYDIDILEDWYINSVMPKDTPAADVVEVVRCKDCKHLTFSDFYGECNRGYLSIVRPDCYCCYGEKRNSETT